MRLVLLVLLSLLSQQLGASVAGLLFDDVGASAMVALRVVFSAAVLLLVTRPSRAALAGLGPRGWAAVVGLGAAMTGMNLAIYEAFARIPQGVAVTFEVLGPLALSVAARPSWRILTTQAARRRSRCASTTCGRRRRGRSSGRGPSAFT